MENDYYLDCSNWIDGMNLFVRQRIGAQVDLVKFNYATAPQVYKNGRFVCNICRCSDFDDERYYDPVQQVDICDVCEASFRDAWDDGMLRKEYQRLKKKYRELEPALKDMGNCAVNAAVMHANVNAKDTIDILFLLLEDFRLSLKGSTTKFNKALIKECGVASEQLEKKTREYSVIIQTSIKNFETFKDEANELLNFENPCDVSDFKDCSNEYVEMEKLQSAKRSRVLEDLSKAWAGFATSFSKLGDIKDDQCWFAKMITGLKRVGNAIAHQFTAEKSVKSAVEQSPDEYKYKIVKEAIVKVEDAKQKLSAGMERAQVVSTMCDHEDSLMATQDGFAAVIHVLDVNNKQRKLTKIREFLNDIESFFKKMQIMSNTQIKFTTALKDVMSTINMKHSKCFDITSQVMTDDGFVSMKDITKGKPIKINGVVHTPIANLFRRQVQKPCLVVDRLKFLDHEFTVKASDLSIIIKPSIATETLQVQFDPPLDYYSGTVNGAEYKVRTTNLSANAWDNDLIEQLAVLYQDNNRDVPYEQADGLFPYADWNYEPSFLSERMKWKGNVSQARSHCIKTLTFQANWYQEYKSCINDQDYVDCIVQIKRYKDEIKMLAGALAYYVKNASDRVKFYKRKKDFDNELKEFVTQYNKVEIFNTDYMFSTIKEANFGNHAVLVRNYDDKFK